MFLHHLIIPIPEPVVSYFGFEVPFISTPANASFCCPTSPLSKLLNGLRNRKYNVKQTCRWLMANPSHVGSGFRFLFYRYSYGLNISLIIVTVYIYITITYLCGTVLKCTDTKYLYLVYSASKTYSLMIDIAMSFFFQMF